jgi:predicted O-methyltransferase YrrM
MEKKHIVEFLSEIGVNLSDIPLGDFDTLGEFTAKKSRDKNSPLYNSVGSFFRPNYERGILIYYLIKKFRIQSYLEIGFGRGYSSVCAAKAMIDAGINGTVTTIDPALSEELLSGIAQNVPHEYLRNIRFLKQDSAVAVPAINEKFDFIYVDGDHRYDAVMKDWQNCRNKFNKFILFDDYHMPTKTERDIDCATVIDSIEGLDKQLLIMDRRIFFDDRRVADADIDYGQVLITNPFFNMKDALGDW